jgi:hypothetical protein
MFRIVKVNVPLEIKADIDDEEDVREKIYDKLAVLMENEEIEWDILEEEDVYEDED